MSFLTFAKLFSIFQWSPLRVCSLVVGSKLCLTNYNDGSTFHFLPLLSAPCYSRPLILLVRLFISRLIFVAVAGVSESRSIAGLLVASLVVADV